MAVIVGGFLAVMGLAMTLVLAPWEGALQERPVVTGTQVDTVVVRTFWTFPAGRRIVVSEPATGRTWRLDGREDVGEVVEVLVEPDGDRLARRQDASSDTRVEEWFGLFIAALGVGVLVRIPTYGPAVRSAVGGPRSHRLGPLRRSTAVPTRPPATPGGRRGSTGPDRRAPAPRAGQGRVHLRRRAHRDAGAA